MALTTIDPTPALVVIDLQKGIVAAHTDSQTAAAVKQATHLTTEFRRHGLPVVLVNVTGRAPGRTEIQRFGSIAALPSGWADLIDELDVLATDAMSDPDADAHRHSTERVFPKLGETATVTDIIDMIEGTR
ncbi:isochorismatase family protein [Streptomyces sp. SID2888]|uniref:isochorismatase family protein n=1 Tax=Streptomyces sp. SID2888 TaxID=2690256 RepID=UPI00136B05CE|nr:isochorismatase family protein [Streptomyces sp. SID2888]MYV50693.1 isochorismatase family protein [Streptomyces sp. SID2888]